MCGVQPRVVNMRSMPSQHHGPKDHEKFRWPHVVCFMHDGQTINDSGCFLTMACEVCAKNLWFVDGEFL